MTSWRISVRHWNGGLKTMLKMLCTWPRIFALFLDASNLTEGLAFVKSAIERARSLPTEDESANHHRQKMIARALFAQGMIGTGESELAFGLQPLQEAIAISRTTGDKLLLGYSLEVFSGESIFRNVPGGQEAAQEGLSIFTNEIDDKWGLGHGLSKHAKSPARKAI